MWQTWEPLMGKRKNWALAYSLTDPGEGAEGPFVCAHAPHPELRLQKVHPWSQTMWSTWSPLREAELRSKRHRPLSRALSLGGVTWGRGGHRARARHRAGVKLLRAPRHSCFWDREKLAVEAVRGGDAYQWPNSFTTIPIVWASTEMGIFSQSCWEEKSQDMVTNQSPKIQKPKLRHMVWKPDEIFEIGDVPPKSVQHGSHPQRPIECLIADCSFIYSDLFLWRM